MNSALMNEDGQEDRNETIEDNLVRTTSTLRVARSSSLQQQLSDTMFLIVTTYRHVKNKTQYL